MHPSYNSVKESLLENGTLKLWYTASLKEVSWLFFLRALFSIVFLPFPHFLVEGNSQPDIELLLDLDTFITYPATGITRQFMAFIRFSSFNCFPINCSNLFLTSAFTLSITHFTSIPSPCSHHRNLYISFLSGSNAFIFSSNTCS